MKKLRLNIKILILAGILILSLNGYSQVKRNVSKGVYLTHTEAVGVAERLCKLQDSLRVCRMEREFYQSEVKRLNNIVRRSFKLLDDCRELNKKNDDINRKVIRAINRKRIRDYGIIGIIGILTGLLIK